jgi:hypothetical protein
MPIRYFPFRAESATFRLPLLAKVPTVKQQETVMKKVISIGAVAMALLGSANFALAQSNPCLTDVTSTVANRAANTHNCHYSGGK